MILKNKREYKKLNLAFTNMTMKKRLIYPVIIEEYHDDGHYFVVTSPNIPGMVTQGDTLEDAAYWAEDAIATMLEGLDEYPTVQNPENWDNAGNGKIVFISVDMQSWLNKNSKTIQKTISIPEYLNKLAKKENINVSRVTTEALKKELEL